MEDDEKQGGPLVRAQSLEEHGDIYLTMSWPTLFDVIQHCEVEGHRDGATLIILEDLDEEDRCKEANIAQFIQDASPTGHPAVRGQFLLMHETKGADAD